MIATSGSRADDRAFAFFKIYEVALDEKTLSDFPSTGSAPYNLYPSHSKNTMAGGLKKIAPDFTDPAKHLICFGYVIETNLDNL
jgi:hypothetical protein